MIRLIEHLGVWTTNKIAILGYSTRFLYRLFSHVGMIVKRPRLLSEQLFFLGNRSISIITVAGLFVGLALALQLYYVLSRFSAEQALGYSVGLSLLREMGPVITALLFTGRAGTALTAEIGLMKSGEQLSALEVMAIDPLRRILAPRFWAGIITLPLLTLMFDLIGVVGAYIVGVLMIGIDPGSFFGAMQDGISVSKDIGSTLLKSMVFGVLINAIALFQGYTAYPSPEGVAKATTQTVITSSLTVLGFNFLLTAFMFS